jgi:DNA polymerase-3 subunit epsilon
LGENKHIKKLLWIDLETTGLDPLNHGIIQLAGIIEIKGIIKEEFNFKVKPIKGDGITKRAMEVHGININTIKSFEDPSSTLERFIALLSKYVDPFNKKDKFQLIGYNSKFDYDFLRKWFEKQGEKWFGSYIWFPPIDVMNLSAYFLSDRRGEISNFKLDNIASLFGIESTDDQLHDAAFDIEMTRELYNKLLEQRSSYGNSRTS